MNFKSRYRASHPTLSVITFLSTALGLLLFAGPATRGEDIKKTDLYKRIRASIDAVPAIDTHDHLRPFEEIPFRDVTDKGKGMTLHSVWQGSYYPWINPLSPWPEGKPFDAWWEKAQHDFKDARATSFYRYLLPAFTDLYGIDFETMTAEQARQLNDRIFENDKSDKWLNHVVTERANIELMLIDPSGLASSSTVPAVTPSRFSTLPRWWTAFIRVRSRARSTALTSLRNKTARK